MQLRELLAFLGSIYDMRGFLLLLEFLHPRHLIILICAVDLQMSPKSAFIEID